MRSTPYDAGPMRTAAFVRRAPWKLVGGLGALFLAVTIAMTFPHIKDIRWVTPGDYGDPVFSQWLLRWELHAFAHRPRGVFNTNIYWPWGNTLVYSDTELAAAPFAAVLSPILGWPLTYNVLYLIGWVASLVSAYVLARWVRISRAGAVLAAFVFTFAAVRMGHYGHFPMLSAFLAPLSMWLLLRFLDERRWWQAAALGVCCAAIFLNAGYIATVLAPALVVIALGWLVATRFRPGERFVTGLALTGGVAAVLAWPLVLKYRAAGKFLKRTYVIQTAVMPHDFLQPADHSFLYSAIEKRLNPLFENRLFPGYLALLLGIVGLVALWQMRAGRRSDAGERDPSTDREPPTEDAVRRRGLILIVLAGVPAFLLSFGTFIRIHGRRITMPFSAVSGLPGFQSIRAFGRFTVIPVLGLGLLAATGYDWLVRGRSERAKVIVACVLGLVMLAEYKSRIIYSPDPAQPAYTAVNKALARLPAGPVVELPMADPDHYTWAFTEAPRMLLSAIDWHPRVNGYSGYDPPGYPDTVRTMNTLDDGPPASPGALALLDQFGVRYLVLRLAPLDGQTANVGLSYYDQAAADRVVAALPADRVAGVTRAGAAMLVTLRPGPPPPP